MGNKLYKERNRDILKELDQKTLLPALTRIFQLCNFAMIKARDIGNGTVIVNLGPLLRALDGFILHELTPVLLLSELKKLADTFAVDLNNELQLYHVPTTITLDSIIENLKATIKSYETMAQQLATQSIDASHIVKLLPIMKKQLRDFERQKTGEHQEISSVRSSPGKSSILGTPEKRLRALKEIFRFYNRQRAFAHPVRTFEAVDAEINTMNLGFFMKFSKDFEIPIDPKVRVVHKCG